MGGGRGRAKALTAVMDDEAARCDHAPRHFPLGAFCRTPGLAERCVVGAAVRAGKIIEGRLTGLLPILPGAVLGPAGEVFPVRVLVDTGADAVYISEKVAAAARWSLMDRRFETDTPLAKVSSMAVKGRLCIRSMTAGDEMTMNVIGATLPEIPAGCDVLLGMGFLHLFHMTFFPNGRFLLSL